MLLINRTTQISSVDFRLPKVSRKRRSQQKDATLITCVPFVFDDRRKKRISVSFTEEKKLKLLILIMLPH